LSSPCPGLSKPYPVRGVAMTPPTPSQNGRASFCLVGFANFPGEPVAKAAGLQPTPKRVLPQTAPLGPESLGPRAGGQSGAMVCGLPANHARQAENLNQAVFSWVQRLCRPRLARSGQITAGPSPPITTAQTPTINLPIHQPVPDRLAHAECRIPLRRVFGCPAAARGSSDPVGSPLDGADAVHRASLWNLCVGGSGPGAAAFGSPGGGLVGGSRGVG
jgi:hypothetical protein